MSTFKDTFKPLVQDPLKLLLYLRKRYVEDGCQHSAAALTYMSLFAVVPLLTVMYAILSAVPAFQEVGIQIQDMVFNNFVPSTGQEVQDYLSQFSQQAQSLTGVGVAFLGVTAILMLKNIEKTFNGIWKTRDNRSGLSSFLLYWAILSLGPIFIGLALAISTYLTSLKILVEVDTIGIGPHLLRLAPYILTSAAFTLLFAAVPNCRVPIKNALVGGVVTALIFEVAKWAFTSVIANSSFQLIYGTFAFIPLFLLWIYLSWLIVLAGAELVNALSGFNTKPETPYSDLTMALAVLEILWRNHKTGGSIAEQDLLRKRWLFDRHSLSADQWTPVRDQLFYGGLLRIADNGHYVLGRDLADFSLWDLTQLLGLTLRPLQRFTTDHPAWIERCSTLLTTSDETNKQQLSQSLAELFTDTEAATVDE